MWYYKLGVFDDSFADTGVKTDTGERINITGKGGVLVSRAESAHVIVPDDDRMPEIDDPGELPDRILTSNLFLLFSLRAKMILDELHLCPHIGQLSTAIRNRAGNDLAEFALYYPGALYDVLDREQSEFSVIGETDCILTHEISKWVFEVKHVPPYDLFFCDNICWVASERLKGRFEENGITNVAFKSLCEVEVVSDANPIFKFTPARN